MPAVVSQFPQAYLVIAGDGKLASTLQAQAKRSPVASHIHLLGSQRQIERFYALLDLFVSSSLWEGLPTVLLESIAADVPIVATQVSGSVKLIKDGISQRYHCHLKRAPKKHPDGSKSSSHLRAIRYSTRRSISCRTVPFPAAVELG